jgi:methylase of polypeptide subunit release factors
MSQVITESPLPPTLRAPAAWAYEPFAMGSDDEFRRLREFLVATGFSEPGLEATAGHKSIYEFVRHHDPRRTAFLDPTDRQSLLVQLFLDGLAIPREIVDRVLPADERALLDRFKLLHPSVSDADKVVASVALYPLEGVFMTSDRFIDAQVVGDGTPADIVYASLTREARRFVEYMPRRACNDYLELCSGSGVAALIAARTFARHATAIDIAERSTRFAEFNARLNGLTNVTALAGDLYAPVAGRQFDVITAHPPYVASFGTEMIYRDGGEDGEQISRGIIAGLPTHLRPGGVFYCHCMMTDREGAPLEQRLREMLGPGHEEFDVVLGEGGSMSPVVQYAGSVLDGRSSPELFARRILAFQRLEITAFVSAFVFIQRRATDRATITRRRVVTARTKREDFDWLIGYAIGTAEWSDADVRRLMDTTPGLVEGTEWRSRMLAEGGEWRSATSQVGTTAPFFVEANDCPPWFAQLLSWCDGRTSGHELLHRCQSQRLVPADVDDLQFGRLLRQLSDAAFLELPQFPLPGH